MQPVYRYTLKKQLRPAADTPGRLLVADSFLINNGMARAPERHAVRFTASCRVLTGMDAETLRHFWQLVLQQIPTQGQWFPRLELLADSTGLFLQARIRPAPEQRRDIRLFHDEMPDRRRQPRHKGTDIAFLAEQRQRIVAMGADEGILCTPSGYLLEGFFSSILWWENGTLCQTPPSRRVLPSVTAALVREIAALRGIPVAWRIRHLHELNGVDAWSVNALHGIRRVVNWPLAPWQVQAHIDRDDWQRALDAHALRPIHTV